MGYVPPKAPSAAELIRADLEPQLSALYGVWSTASAFLGPHRRSGYQAYLDDLYGGRRPDRWFLFLNYALLALMIALPIALVWALSS